MTGFLKRILPGAGEQEASRYLRSQSGAWIEDITQQADMTRSGLSVRIQASVRDASVLFGTDVESGKSRIIFDPNPQLKLVALGKPELYSWRDDEGRDWKVILYMPLAYQPGKKYPLVIQNHGFQADRYMPSGGFPSAFAAQELASVGIMVLHVQDCAGRSTPVEGPCNVGGYGAAVSQLAKAGLVDPDRIGIIGFSRTVYYMLEALTASRLHFRAASITDGITLGYLDYVLGVGSANSASNEQAAIIGGRPFGSGLEQWMKNSPVFNMNNVTTPVRVVATRSGSVLEMWEPYALLRDMHKPVDFVVLNTDEHVITNPLIRVAAQGGNVDWFRFWLQGYEDPDPRKMEQYKRWRELRILEREDVSRPRQ